jgi:thiol-disulfide isomerase/thioredoxin
VGRKTNKQQRQKQAVTAREKAAASRAERQRAEQRRRAMTILSAVVVLVLVGGVITWIAVTHHSTKTTAIADNRASAPVSVVNAVRSVPVSTLNAVGQGTVIAQDAPAKEPSGPTLTAGGKPELLFIGAEFCPYCAAERWSMAVALSRFGTLNGIKMTASSSTDVDPSTATLDFVSAKYTSNYLSFVAVENQDRDRKPLQSTTKAQTALWLKYDNNQESFPFLDFGNKYAITGPTFDPGILKGLSQSQIAARLANPKDAVAKAVDGAANTITASICGMTNNKPANVCSSPTISGLLTKINA